MPARRRVLFFAAVALARLFAFSAEAAGRHAALPTDALLVQLARDRGLERHGEQSTADVDYIRALLHAAVRLNPKNAEAHMLLYELASLRGESNEMSRLLERLIEADSANESVFALWLDNGAGAGQTIEQRRAWLEGLLSREWRDSQMATLHVRLARLAMERMDLDEARRQLDLARNRDAHSVDLALATYDMPAPDAPVSDRLKAMLDLLELNPTDTQLAWSVGTMLDARGYCDEAAGFYEQVARVSEALGAPARLGWRNWMQLSQNAFARKDKNRAGQYAQAAFTQRGDAFEPAYYGLWLLEQVGDEANALSMRNEVSRFFARLNDQSSPRATAEAAWFYCRQEPQPKRALELAESAWGRESSDPFILRVLGWAQANSGRAEDAKKTLTPLATRDAYAAAKLAELFLAEGATDEAARVVAEAPLPGPACDERSLLEGVGLPPLEAGKSEGIDQALAGYDRRSVDFLFNPSRYIAAEIKFDDLSPGAGEPWWAEFSLTNRGPFTISIGPGWMLNPVFLVSLRLEGDQIRDFPNLFTVSLDLRRALAPGESVKVRRVIDIGPVRRVIRQTPQVMQRVSVWAILDPVQGADGAWRPSATGVDVRQATLNRAPSSPSRELWHLHLTALAGDSEPSRFRALETFGELLGESQRNAMKKLDYRPATIPTDRLSQSLREALASGAWETRVRALEALQAAGLDAATLEAARTCLKHEHWLVRMMALRLIARQGAEIRPVAEQLASDDPDETVRELAQSYVELFTPPATQPVVPAMQPESAPSP